MRVGLGGPLVQPGIGMDADDSNNSANDPAHVYRRRLQQLKLLQSSQGRHERTLGYAKLGLVVLTLIATLLLLRDLQWIELLIVPVIAFLLLAVWQERLIRQLRVRLLNIEFYERGLERIDGHWAGKGEAGDRFLDPLHPYARDLDLFGAGSLFELLCTVRTRAGEEILAMWLLSAAPLAEILSRQQAVQEMRDDVAFRENLSSLGSSLRLGVHTETLAAWGNAKPVFAQRKTRIVTRILCVLWILSIAAWAIFGVGAFAAAITILNLAWSHHIDRRLDRASDSFEKAADDLDLLAGILALIENAHWTAPHLVDLKLRLQREGVAPSAAIRKLTRIVELEKSRHNPVGRLLGILTFWNAQLIFIAERWQREFGPTIGNWLQAVGEVEALAALSGYAFENPRDPFPEFIAQEAAHSGLFEAESIAHPLLHSGKSVRNDIALNDGHRLIVLSGPNMAGKSTFIRSIGVNAALAQCGAPVRTARLKLSPLNVAASICILDSLSGGVSRFYAEIHRIKLIFDLASGPTPVLFLLDELLSGTNSHDRLVGSEFIARGLMERKAIGIVSTHDLALAAIPESLGARAVNLHFEDRVEDGRLIFDYKLKPGIVETSSAIELMRSIGLGVEG